MKKLFVLLGVAVALVSCEQTEMEKARFNGTDYTILVDSGLKVVDATWKETGTEGVELWYFAEPMDSGYVPSVKVFQCVNTYGIATGSVIFKEQK